MTREDLAVEFMGLLRFCAFVLIVFGMVMVFAAWAFGQ